MAKKHKGYFSGMGKIVGVAATVLSVVLVAYVGMAVLSSLVPGFVNNTRNLTTAILGADWGNSTANSLNSPIALIISIGALFALVGLAFFTLKGASDAE